MASTSAGSPGPNSNYITLQRALRALRTDLESAVEQARSTGFATVPSWDVDRIIQVAAYLDLHDEYWQLQHWALKETADGHREYVKRLLEKSKQPQMSKEHTSRQLASKPAQHQAPKIRSEPERPLPESDDERLGPVIFRRLKEAQRAQQQVEQQTQRQDASIKPTQHQALKIRSEPEQPLPESDDERLGPAIFRRLKGAQQAQQQAEQQAKQQAKYQKQRQDTSSTPIQHQAPRSRSEPQPLPESDDERLGPAIFRRLKEAQQAQQQAEQKTQRQIASSKPEVPKKPVPSVATPPAPAKPADELAAQMGQLYIKSPPGTFARLLPPITGDQATIETLTVDGWTRWESGANLEWATTAMGPDGKLILKQDGMPAVARKLDPRAYGGTKKYDLGYCTGALYSCEFPDWRWCPYRHWAPEPKEHRWMDPQWLVKNNKKLQRVPFPPDHPSVNYRGRDRRGFNDKWLVRPSVLKEAEESKFQAPELRVSPTGWERETITATPKTWRASDTRRVFEWSED